MSTSRRLPASPFHLAFVAALVLLLGAAAQARAADSVYWADYEPGSVGFAALAGGGGGSLDITPVSALYANGLAIDAAAGKIYWITAEAKLRYANLSGGGGGEISTAGASQGFSLGLAIDPAGGRAYWVDGEANVINYANLNGSGGGILDTTGTIPNDPSAVAVEPAGGRINWTDSGTTDRIGYANLTGGGGGIVNTGGAAGTAATGLALDVAAGLVYWADYDANQIFYASLSGLGGGALNTAGATVDAPFGVAVDPVAGRVYWVNEQGKSVSYAALNGSGGADLNTAGAPLGIPAFPALLKAPSPLSAPNVSGKAKPGSTLTCNPGTWAPDQRGANLTRAPQTTSVQWLKDGQAVTGATAPTFKVAKAGAYSCQSIAANHAGSTAQASNAVAVFSLGKVKLNQKNGTAKVALQVPGAGKAMIAGRQLVKQTKFRKAGSPGTITLLVKSKGKAKKTLGKKGKVKVRATITFVPAAGSFSSQERKLTLKRKLSD